MLAGRGVNDNAWSIKNVKKLRLSSKAGLSKLGPARIVSLK
jgi:hypothetical protein